MVATVDESPIATHLRLLTTFQRASGLVAPDDWAYPSYYGMVLELGQDFERKPLPTRFRRMKVGQCFGNAFHCASQDDRYRYVEGFAQGVIPTEHAWVLDTEDGKIFDPTWPRTPGHTQYRGIVFPTWFLHRWAVHCGVAGVLVSDPLHADNLLLRHGEKVWESKEACEAFLEQLQ